MCEQDHEIISYQVVSKREACIAGAIAERSGVSVEWLAGPGEKYVETFVDATGEVRKRPSTLNMNEVYLEIKTCRPTLEDYYKNLNSFLKLLS